VPRWDASTLIHAFTCKPKRAMRSPVLRRAHFAALCDARPPQRAAAAQRRACRGGGGESVNTHDPTAHRRRSVGRVRGQRRGVGAAARRRRARSAPEVTGTTPAAALSCCFRTRRRPETTDDGAVTRSGALLALPRAELQDAGRGGARASCPSLCARPLSSCINLPHVGTRAEAAAWQPDVHGQAGVGVLVTTDSCLPFLRARPPARPPASCPPSTLLTRRA
jgi:hypothetical protein